MKIIIITGLIVIFCLYDLTARSQTFAEWWQQRKTRIKRLKQQVAALETLKETVEEGYSQAETAVDSVEFNVEEELTVNQLYVESLKVAKPSFRDAPEVVSCYALVDMLVANVNNWLAIHSKNPLLSPLEKEVITGDLNFLVTEAHNELNRLAALTRDEEIAMDDGERYEAICEVEMNMRVTYDAMRASVRTVDLILEAREQQRANAAYLKTLLR